ncbi:MAG: nuclear transport factor 2 family protein [Flammeovirgaceae bacterium]
MDTLQINYDTLKKDSWSEKEVKNVKLIIDFMQNLMNNHHFDYVREKFSNQQYLQHNRGIPDGMAGLISFVENFAKQFPEYAYDVKHIYADGDYVIFHSQATTKAKHRGNDKEGYNIMDTWKIKDGEIVEHWDALQPMSGFMRFYNLLTGGKIRNSNGVY